MLATVFALGLSACGGDDENDGGNTGYGSGTKTEQTDTARTAPAPTPAEPRRPGANPLGRIWNGITDLFS